MDWKKMLEQWFPTLGAMGVEEAAKALDGWAEDAKDPMKKLILGLVADAVEKHGMEGLNKAKDAVLGLLEGKEVELDFTDLETASNALAMLQNAEADRKSAAEDFMVKVGETLGPILGALIKGLIASV